MYVHREDGLVMEFKQFRTGLYYFDVAEYVIEQGRKLKDNKQAGLLYAPSFTLVTTVEENIQHYTIRDVRNAEKARILCRNISPPSQSEFEHI